MLPRPRRPRRGAPRAAVAGPGRRQRTAGAGVPAPKGTPWARSPSPPPPPVAPRVSVPGPPHSAAGGPREGGGGCAGDGARDRPPRPAGADHGRDCGGGACAQLLVSLRLAFRLRLRLLAAGAAAAARTSEPHRLKMAARRLPLLPPGAGSDDTAASRSPANQRGRGSRPATVARRDLVLPRAPGAALGREGLAGPTGPGGRQVPSVQSTRAPPKEPAKCHHWVGIYGVDRGPALWESCPGPCGPEPSPGSDDKAGAAGRCRAPASSTLTREWRTQSPFLPLAPSSRAGLGIRMAAGASCSAGARCLEEGGPRPS